MNYEQQNPFDDENGHFYVLINAKRQYSLWPAFAKQPAGWKSVIGPESRSTCIAYIETHWLELHPSENNEVVQSYSD